jgi:hypothetical protein
MVEKEPKIIDSISDLIKEVSPYYKEKGDPQEHTLTYESYSETLEPLYYFVLDLMEDFALKPEKLIDNFSPSPGSTEFGELGTRATVMQQQASKMLVDINQVLKSVLNILYDLKDFKTRLQSYDGLQSKDENIKKSAILGLKQLWMDRVDINKGNSSIKAMASQGGFPILIDAFLAINNVEDAAKLDLNDRVKRILFPRIDEFNSWLEQSEKELRSRYEIEKNYLRSQVNSLKLYSRWAKPYLLSAQKLEQKVSKSAALVNSFNRTILQLTLLGKKELDIKAAAIAGNLPYDFSKDSVLKKLKRKYYSCVLIDFVFRAVPQRSQAQATYIGRVEIKFRGYALNEDELAKLEQEMKKSDMGDVLRLIEGITDDSLKQIQGEINSFLEEGEPEEETKKPSSDETNPFLALIGYYNKPKETSKTEEKEEKEIIVKKDTWLEATQLRDFTGKDSEELAFNLFDIYKKAHGMPSYT